MVESSYGIDYILVYWWEIKYKDDKQHKSAVPPYTIDESGPLEMKNTAPTGPTPVQGMELAMMEMCPHCEETLHLYSTKDIVTKEKIYRCKNCGTELVNSAIGWVEKETVFNARRKSRHPDQRA
jgi:predicted RNA-binding Zn-ribbon protein involved in translation (DUF1610 family)